MMLCGSFHVHFRTDEESGALVAVPEFHDDSGDTLWQGDPIPIEAGNYLSYGPVSVCCDVNADVDYEPDYEGKKKSDGKDAAQAQKPAKPQSGPAVKKG